MELAGVEPGPPDRRMGLEGRVQAGILILPIAPKYKIQDPFHGRKKAQKTQNRAGSTDEIALRLLRFLVAKTLFFFSQTLDLRRRRAEK